MAQKTTAPTTPETVQFDMNPDVVKACVAFVQKHCGNQAFDEVIDLSEETRAFSSLLESGCSALAIDPQHPCVKAEDFLNWEPKDKAGKLLVIGKPPFGKNGSRARQAFNHAAESADGIAVAMPRSFRKASMQNRLDLNFHLVASLELPGEAFIVDGQPRTVPTDFQIWERRDTPRPIETPPRTHEDFAFCSREEADFAVQRVGNNAGRIKDIGKAGSANSHYFLRATRSPDLLRAQFEKIDFDRVRHSTAGIPSIAKTEIVALYEELSRNA